MVATDLPALAQEAHCLLLLVDQAQKELWTRGRGAIGGELRFPLGVGLAGQAVMTGNVIHVKDAKADPTFYAPLDALSIERDEGHIVKAATQSSPNILDIGR